MSDLDITVLDNHVNIKGTRTITAPDGATYLRRERPTGTFARAWNLPNAVEAEKVEAALTNGILTVTLPKTAKMQPRRITVKTA
jgi:HSP20 family protein